MVRKEKMKDFFEKKELPNGKSSYLSAAFDPIVNTYFFANLSQLVTELKVERDQGAGVTRDDDEAARNRKYAAWEAQHPDWNKVMPGSGYCILYANNQLLWSADTSSSRGASRSGIGLSAPGGR